MFETGDGPERRVGDVSDHGFMIFTDAEQASWLQGGVRQVKGKYWPKTPRPQIPPRPFMGFSRSNINRISKMIRDYLAD
jgi:phage gpG-like protein